MGRTRPAHAPGPQLLLAKPRFACNCVQMNGGQPWASCGTCDGSGALFAKMQDGEAGALVSSLSDLVKAGVPDLQYHLNWVLHAFRHGLDPFEAQEAVMGVFPHIRPQGIQVVKPGQKAKPDPSFRAGVFIACVHKDHARCYTRFRGLPCVCDCHSVEPDLFNEILQVLPKSEPGIHAADVLPLLRRESLEHWARIAPVTARRVSLFLSTHPNVRRSNRGGSYSYWLDNVSEKVETK